MRMEYGGEPGYPAELFIVPGEGFQGVLNTVKHQAIDGFLVSPCQISKMLGKGEGNQIVFSREALVQLIFDPLLILMILAMRAVSVAARVWDIFFLAAVMIGALRQHVQVMYLPALLHGPEGLVVSGQD